jgi:hypothetical protein
MDRADPARARCFDAAFKTKRGFKRAHATVKIVGVGFFDKIHGQRGVAPNGIELHPVLGICIGAACALEE